MFAALPLAALLLLPACSTSETPQPSSNISTMFATPEWAKPNTARTNTARRAITQNDLMNADGSCAMEAAATDGVAPAGEGEAALAGQGTLPTMQTGVALGMTECQVLQRTGAPDTFNIGAEGSDRITTMTVTHGTWPGSYRFRAGRLVSVERVEVPAPAKPTRTQRQNRTSNVQQAPLRGAQR